MVQFKCKLTGNICQFEYEWDIADMRKHPQYEEVKEETVKEEAKKPNKKTTKVEE